jgi:putative transposase
LTIPNIYPQAGALIMSDQTKGKRVFRKFSAEEKKKILDKATEAGVVAAAKEFNVNKGMIYRWQNAYTKQGIEGLAAKSSRPHHQPKKTTQWLIDKVLGLKKARPEMGVQAASQHLARFEAVELSANTVGKIFKKHNLLDGDQAAAQAAYMVRRDDGKLVEQAVEKELDEWERFARPNPNDMWQMDIMSFYIRDAHRVYLISALDDCSRMIVNWGLFREQTSDNVLEVLKAALAKHGAPGEVLTDQGAQFKHWGGVTRFEKLLKSIDVNHIKARAHHPQTCGKIEAFHKTIHRELIDKEFFVSQESAAEKIARFVEHYNYARPHSALSGFTPADRYFGIIDGVKRYLADMTQPKNIDEETSGKIGIGRSSKVYLVGRVLGQEVRIQELAGSLSIHVNNQLLRDISLLH